jgi:2-polyprenyl-3-methyl-5-hydroxy-6-metoxy-1,4-benzoquinol methylase
MTASNASNDAQADPAIHHDWVVKYRTSETEPFYELAFDEIARRLGATPGATVLDAGCGSCAKSVLLAARGYQVVATDFSAKALELAAHTVRSHGFEERISLSRADLLALPFRGDQFQYIVCWGVLMHIPQLERALAELQRVLAPGGVLVISEGNMYGVQSIAVRLLKRLLGKSPLVRTQAGIETHEETPHGKLVTRQTDLGWFVAHMQGLGLRPKARIPGQFSELYTILPWRRARRGVHAFNHLWFRYVRLARPACANILIFEKPAASLDLA